MESLRAENEAITKYQFNKDQIDVPLSFSLSLSLYLLLFLSRFSPFSKSEKNDVSLSVHSKLHRSSLGFISAVQRLGAGRWDTLNGLRTS